MTIVLKIGEIGRVLTGKTPKTSSSNFWDGDIPFYTPSDMDGRRRLDRVKRYITAEGLKTVKNSAIPPNSVMVSCIGSDMGKVSLNVEHGVTNQQINTVVPDPEIVDYHYLYYSFLPRKAELQMLASGGSAQPILNKGQFSQIELSIPPLKHQKAIAHILGTLDDKIELNRKMNETLEEIAKAIFKSWFVDFDPVRAKAEGRPTGLPAEISDLFPDTFEDTELGQIPSGWAHRGLGVLVTPQRGKTITKSKCVEGGVPVVAGGLAPAYYHNVANVSAPVVTVSASGANAGFARIYHEDIWASDCSYISKRQSRFVYIWYIFLKMNQSRIYHMQQGAAQPHIYPSDLMRMEVICPEDEILWRHLDTIVSPMFERISICDKQNKVLIDLRDTLLPKLISGELRVPDAEKFIQEAGI